MTQDDILNRPKSAIITPPATPVIQPNQEQLQAEHQANMQKEAEARIYEEGVKAGQRAARSKSSSKADEINRYHDNVGRMINNLMPVETPEQRKKRERRDRARRIISTVGDGITALANMHFAANGGVPLVKPQLAQTLNQRFQEERQYRNANMDRYINAHLRNEANRQNALRSDALSQYREFQATNQAAEIERRKAKDEETAKQNEWLRQYKAGELDLKREIAENNRLYREGLISVAEFNARSRELSAKAAWLRAQGYDVDKESSTTDYYGRTKTTRSTDKKTPAGGSSGGSSGSSSSGGGGKDYSQYKQNDWDQYKQQ